jgi:formate/nitrite transporter
MFLDTVDQFAALATAKAGFLRRSPLGFWISSMMAGAYVGLGIILIFCVGANVDPGIRPVVMGASFGIALTLVIFAGSDLFTGHTMFMSLGWLRGRASAHDVAACWSVSWAGNLVGCVLLAVIFVAGGGGLALAGKSPLIVNVAAAKMNAPALELVARAMLCNWLVCLAIWTSARMKSDTAKCIAIFWCLCVHRERLRAFGCQHDVAVDRPSRRPSANRDACGNGLEPLMGDHRQRRQRRRHHGARLLGRLAGAAGCRARNAIGRRRIEVPAHRRQD